MNRSEWKDKRQLIKETDGWINERENKWMESKIILIY